MLVLSLLICFQRWHVRDEPLDQDIAGYAVLSHEMLNGRKLYSDLWERKPPLVFATFAGAELVVGYGPREIFLLSVVTGVGTLICLYRVGGPITAILWALLSGDIWLAGDQPNAEGFINLCLAAAAALMLNLSTKHHRLQAILLGLLFAIATLYKHHVVIICATMLGASLLKTSLLRTSLLETSPLDAMRTPDEPGAVRKSASRDDAWITCGVFAAVWAVVIAYFALTGRLDDFYIALFQQNFVYAGSLSANLLAAVELKNLFPPAMAWALAPAAIISASILFSATQRKASARPGSNWLLMIAYIASAWIVVALPGYFWAHYYQLLVPPVCIAAGWCGSFLITSKQGRSGAWRYLPLGIILTAAACWQAAAYRLSPLQISREKYVQSDLPEQQSLGVALRRILKPTEQFWELGEENEIYFAAQKSPPSGLLYLEPLQAGQQRETFADRLLADLKRSPPDAVVINQRWVGVIPKQAGILPWVNANYVSDRGSLSRGTYRILLRRDSDLARRLGAL